MKVTFLRARKVHLFAGGCAGTRKTLDAASVTCARCLKRLAKAKEAK